MPRPRGSTPWFRKDRKMWFATIDGKQISLNISDPADTSGAADALHKLLAARIQSVPSAPPLTVGEAVTVYLARAKERVKPSTYTGYAWFLGQFADWFGADVPLSGVTADRVERSARREKWSSSTRHDYIGAVGVLLKDSGCPMRLRRPPKESRGADAVWTEPEWLLMCGAARGDFRPLLTVLRETGCRPAEAAGLTCEGVDWGNRSCRLKIHKTAGKGKVRVLHFSDAAMGVLLEQRRQYAQGHLFLNEESAPFTGLSLSRRCALCRERAGVKRPITLYGLRHTYATKALALGASNAQVAALVGNSEAMITKHYAHIDADAKLLKELAERVSKAG